MLSLHSATLCTCGVCLFTPCAGWFTDHLVCSHSPKTCKVSELDSRPKLTACRACRHPVLDQHSHLGLLPALCHLLYPFIFYNCLPYPVSQGSGAYGYKARNNLGHKHQSHTHIYGHIGNSNYFLYIFGLWGKTNAPGENPTVT